MLRTNNRIKMEKTSSIIKIDKKSIPSIMENKRIYFCSLSFAKNFAIKGANAPPMPKNIE